jgi:hypothetical protein
MVLVLTINKNFPSAFLAFQLKSQQLILVLTSLSQRDGQTTMQSKEKKEILNVPKKSGLKRVGNSEIT